MLNNVQVRSRKMAEKFVSEKLWAAISISTKEGEHPELSTENRVDCLQMTFPDIAIWVEPEHLPKHKLFNSETLFNENHAHMIFDFVEKMQDKVETLLVHCEAGISRSPAVAAVIDKLYLGADASSYFEKYQPNTLVYFTLLHTAADMGKIDLVVVEEIPAEKILDEVPLDIVD